MPFTASAATSSQSSKTVRKASAVTAKKVQRKTRVGKPSVARSSLPTTTTAHGNPLLRSSTVLVQDLNSGEVMLEKNAGAVISIASITKLMTAIVVLDQQPDLSEALSVTNDDVDRLKGTTSRLTVGTTLSREEFLRLALMSSENRAASVLGRNFPGGNQAFLEAMNSKAHALGMHDTKFFDGTGLNKDNVSSARDLAKLVAASARYPLIREFSTAREYAVNVRGRTRQFRNTNSLVASADWQIGVSKTGYISESGRCLVMQAWMKDKPVAIVLMDSWGRFSRQGDANRIRRWLETELGTHQAERTKPIARDISSAV